MFSQFVLTALVANHILQMLKSAILCCAYLALTAASDLEENCVVAHLKQRNLLNFTTHSNFYNRLRTKNCDPIVKKIVKTLFEETFDYLDQDASVDNKTYRECLKSEFDRLQLDVKFLKVKAYENEPSQMKLETIRDNFVSAIKLNCSKVLESGATTRFRSFISKDDGGLSPKMKNHPAVLKIKSNLPCLSRYAIEKQILDLSTSQLKVKPLNQLDEKCMKIVDEVTARIMDEWHIHRYTEDDEIQRCYIDNLLRTHAIDLFIKNVLLTEMKLTLEQKDIELDNFLKTSNIVHELTYECYSKGFQEL